MGQPHMACKDVAMMALSTGEWMWMSTSHSRDLVMSVSLPSWNFCTTFLWTWLSTVLFGRPCTKVFLGSPYSFSPFISSFYSLLFPKVSTSCFLLHFSHPPATINEERCAAMSRNTDPCPVDHGQGSWSEVISFCQLGRVRLGLVL